MTVRRWSDPGRPGRIDDFGEWWACDPYPTWYRWEGSALILRPFGKPWPGEDPRRMPVDTFLYDANPGCQHVYDYSRGPLASGIRCALCPGWFCY